MHYLCKILLIRDDFYFFLGATVGAGGFAFSCITFFSFYFLAKDFFQLPARINSPFRNCLQAFMSKAGCAGWMAGWMVGWLGTVGPKVGAN